MKLFDWLRRHDPGFIALRRAGRAAIVMPAVFAVAEVVIGNPVLATFTAFGSFATLLFADFNGPMRERIVSQTALVLAGAALVCVGTLGSQHSWVAVPMTFVVAFAVLFAGVISLPLASATNALLLSFVLAVTLPGSPSAAPDRVLGWLLAGGASILAIALLWPAPVKEPLRVPTATVCRLCARRLRAEAGCVRSDYHPRSLEERQKAATEASAAVEALRTTFFRTPYRPTGLTATARILVGLVDKVIWLDSILDRMPFEPEHGPSDESVARVKLAAAEVLERAADVLQKGAGAAAGLRAALDRLNRTRADMERSTTDTLPDQHSAAVAAARAGAGPGEAAADFVGTLMPSFRAQELATSVRAIGTSVDLLVANFTRSTWQRLLGRNRPEAVGSSIVFARQGAAAHVEVHSVWLHNSLRGAAALSVGVLVVELAGVQHAFWVLLGSLAVLRSNALTTGQNALRGIAGTAVGIVIGGVLVYFVGSQTPALWALLPIAVFFGGIAPAVVSFAAGQAGFTATVLILYNIIAPSGWQIGIVRAEDVAIGCVVSLAVGVLFWPRGAASALSRSLSEALSDSARYLDKAVDYGVSRCDSVHIIESEPVDEARRATAASRRLDDAFRNYLAERGTKRLSLADLTTVMNAVVVLQLTADAVLDLWSSVGRGASGDRAQARREVRGAGERMSAWFAQAAGALLGDQDPPRPSEVDHASGRRLVAALGRDIDEGHERGAAAAVRMIWTAEHIDTARHLEKGVAGPVEKTFTIRRSRRGGGPRRLRAAAQSASA